MNFLIRTRYGLCNRISWLCGHIYCLRRKYDNPNIYILWEEDSECPGSYFDIFEKFQKPKIKWYDSRDKIKNINFEKIISGQHCISRVLNMYNFNCDPILEAKIIKNKLIFKNEIINICNEFIKNNFNNNTIGLHIRRTDHNVYKSKSKFHSDDNTFFNLMDNEISVAKNTKFFLATDNSSTQKFYQKKYGERIIIFDKVIDSNNLRNTSLFHSGIDLYLLSKCKKLEGSYQSSYSRLAIILNAIDKNNINIINDIHKKNLFRKRSNDLKYIHNFGNN